MKSHLFGSRAFSHVLSGCRRVGLPCRLPSVVNSAGLDLSGPGRRRPAEFGDEAQGIDPAPAGLLVSLAPR